MRLGAFMSGKLKGKLGDWADHSFALGYDYDPLMYQEECRRLWCAVIEQAVNEYIDFKFSRDPEERKLYYLAKEFLFDDNYKMQFGDKLVSLEELAGVLGLDLEWIRYGIRRKENKENSGKDYPLGTQLSLFDVKKKV